MEHNKQLKRVGKPLKQRQCPNSIRYYRVQRGLLMRNLAERLNITVAGVQWLETRAKTLNSDQLKTLSDLFACRIEDLIEPNISANK